MSSSVRNFEQFKNAAWITATLTSREIQGRLKGSIGGVAWLFLMPLLMLTLYTTIFNGIFKARIGNTGDPFEYAFSLSCGLMFFNFFSEVLGRAPGVITSSPNFVKKVIFPLPLLAVVNVSTSLLTAAVYFLVVAVLGVYLGMMSFQGLFWLLFMTLITLPMALGLSFFLSAVGVYIRDVQQIIGPILSVLLFASPIFYPLEAIPKQLARLMVLNPISVPIETVRASMIAGQHINYLNVGLYFLAGCIVLVAGYWVFNRLRGGFSDLL